MQLAESTWKQVATYLEHDDRVIVPVGSTEQHGPRAVIGTDHLVPAGIAAEAGRRSGVLVAPTIVYGMSLHHMAFPGTISLRPSTLLQVVYDVLASLDRHGFRRILLLNGHGGNDAPLLSGIAEANDAHLALRIKLIDWWNLSGVKAVLDEAFGDKEDGHGTPGETSVTMALHPGIVSNEKVELPQVGSPRVWRNADVWAENYPDGSGGADANLATEEWGKKLLEAAVQAVVQELELW